MHVKSLHLKGIRGIEDLQLEFGGDQDSPACKLVIGKNGTGKSSVLRSVVLGLASVSDAAALLAETLGSPFVSLNEGSGSIEVIFVNSDGNDHSRKVVISKGSGTAESVRIGNGPQLQDRPPFVVALGAGRSNEGASSVSTYSIVHSTYMLFNYEGTFVQPELTLRRLQDYLDDEQHAGLYDAILYRIESALGLGDGGTISLVRGGGVMVSGPHMEDPIPLHSWADGYRVTLNWILDIYAWAMMHGKSIDDQGHVHGILLLDEIEQHLHPSMQRGIFQSLKELFPRMQILASTHSPLVLQGVGSNEIISLQRIDNRIYEVPVREYAGHSVEDLLTAEELFETPAYSIAVEEMRREYRALIRKGSLSAEERRRLEVLGGELAGLRVLSPQVEDETLNRLEDRLSELTGDQN